jgi:hypothetical protein
MRLRSAVLPLLVILGLLAAPVAVEGQQTRKVWRIGFLDPGSSPANLAVKGPFAKGSRPLGKSRVEISSWSTAGQKGTRTDCPNLQPTWYGHVSM